MATLEHATRVATLLESYRELVAELRAELEGLGAGHAGLVGEKVAHALRAPVATELISAGGNDVLELTARTARMAETFTPSAASTATSLAHHITILLLQQIDLAWWSDAEDIEDSAALEDSDAFVDMHDWRREGRIKFSFSLASDRLVPRARNYAIRHWFPDWAPGTPGPSTAMARPEMVRLLNSLAIEFSHRAGPEVPPLWVNCITRSVADQCRLQELGFAAHLPSAHCRGWAADLEVAWFARFGAERTLVEMLNWYGDQGVLNAIDEGQIWHISPNPAAIDEWRV
ncbi:MAG: hypothetical protein KDC23_07680 [Actinobacteria bacterium]|nr:hypothetical protein [Actinomycetota bacterium]